jgi:hypothetical protein
MIRLGTNPRTRLTPTRKLVGHVRVSKTNIAHRLVPLLVLGELPYSYLSVLPLQYRCVILKVLPVL